MTAVGVQKRISVANAPCSWGVHEIDREGERSTCDKVLDEMSAAGYTGTELGDFGFMPSEPAALAETLRNRKLSMVGAFVPVDFSNEQAHEEGVKYALAHARLIARVGDKPFIVLSDDNGKVRNRADNAGRIRPDDGLTVNQWQTFAAGVEKVARAVLAETGLKCVFHHHCAGFVETPQEVERLLELTDPELVGLCLDTGHYTFGGGNALAAMTKFDERIWHVHFKDCSLEIAERSRQQKWNYMESIRNGVFCELGKGSVDFAGIKKILDERNYSGWIVVEQDIIPGLGTPLESAKRNREYLTGIGL